MHARRTTLVFLTNGVGAVTGLVGLFFIGRFMSPAAFGAFGFAMSFLGLWLVLADLGLDRAHGRHMTLGIPVGDCVATFRGLKLITLVLFTVGALASILVWTHSARLGDATGVTVLLAAFAYAFLFVVRTVPTATLNALKLTGSVQLMVLAEHLVKTPLLIGVALFFGYMTHERIPFPAIADWIAGHTPFHRPMTGDEGGLLIALAWASGILASLVAGLVILRRQSLPAGRFDRRLAWGYMHFAVPVALVASTRILFANLDAVFIGWFLAAENVGYYFAADRLSMVLYMVPLALQTVFFPVFAELAARQEVEVLRQLARTVHRTLSLVMVLGVLLFVTFPAEGIRVFLGDPFLPARFILPILAVYVLLLAFTTVATNLVLVLGQPYKVAGIGLLSLLVNVVLNTLLIPDALFGVRLFGFHSAGAAIATVTAQGLAFVLIAREARRLTGGATLGAATAKHLTAAAVTGLVLWLLRPLLIGGAVRIWELGLAGLVATAVYLAALVALRELTRADLHMLGDALHPRRMVVYIREEVRDKRPGTP